MPTEPTTVLALQAVIALLQEVTGSPTYHYDLSGAGTVYLGENIIDPNHTPASVAVGPASVGTEDSLNGISYAGRSMRIYIYATIPGDPNDYETRLFALWRLGDDIANALSPSALRDKVSSLAASRGPGITNITLDQGIATGANNSPLGRLAMQLQLTFTRLLTGGGV